jgi:hypothetical protein
MKSLHGLSRSQRLAWLGQTIMNIQAAAVADAVPRRRGVTRAEHVAHYYDPHAATECAHLIERVLFPEGTE